MFTQHDFDVPTRTKKNLKARSAKEEYIFGESLCAGSGAHSELIYHHQGGVAYNNVQRRWKLKTGTMSTTGDNPNFVNIKRRVFVFSAYRNGGFWL